MSEFKIIASKWTSSNTIYKVVCSFRVPLAINGEHADQNWSMHKISKVNYFKKEWLGLASKATHCSSEAAKKILRSRGYPNPVCFYTIATKKSKMFGAWHVVHLSCSLTKNVSKKSCHPNLYKSLAQITSTSPPTAIFSIRHLVSVFISWTEDPQVPLLLNRFMQTPNLEWRVRILLQFLAGIPPTAPSRTGSLLGAVLSDVRAKAAACGSWWGWRCVWCPSELLLVRDRLPTGPL